MKDEDGKYGVFHCEVKNCRLYFLTRDALAHHMKRGDHFTDDFYDKRIRQ